MFRLISGIMPLPRKCNQGIPVTVSLAVMKRQHQMKRSLKIRTRLLGSGNNLGKRQPLMAQQIKPVI